MSLVVAFLGFSVASEAAFFNKTGAEWERLFLYPFMASHLVVVFSLLPFVIGNGFGGRSLLGLWLLSLLWPILSIFTTALDWSQPIASFVVNYLFVFVTGIFPVVLVYSLVFGIFAAVKNS